MEHTLFPYYNMETIIYLSNPIQVFKEDFKLIINFYLSINQLNNQINNQKNHQILIYLMNLTLKLNIIIITYSHYKYSKHSKHSK